MSLDTVTEMLVTYVKQHTWPIVTEIVSSMLPPHQEHTLLEPHKFVVIIVQPTNVSTMELGQILVKNVTDVS